MVMNNAKVLLEGGKIIDSLGDHPTEGCNILIEGELIGRIRKETEPVAPDVERINVSGMTVMPGLIEAHLHLAFAAAIEGTSSPAKRAINRFTARPSSFVLGAYVNGLKCVECGYTTVRDCGSHGDSVLALRDAIDYGHVVGPRILAGGTITSTMGHFDENWPVHLPRPNEKYVADGADDIRRAVRERVREQVDFIKTSTSDSWSTTRSKSWWRNYTLEELRALAEEAHAWDKSVSCHAYDAEPSVKNAVVAGINNIDHGIFLDEGVVELMKERGTTLVPTMSVIKTIFLQGEGARDTNPYRVPDIARRSVDVWEAHKRSVQMAFEAGIKVGSGTDATGSYGLHGNYAKELEMLTEAGMTSMEAIRAATKVNSEIVGLGDKIGTLEQGKLADLIVVDGDPSEDVRILQDKARIKLVVIGGKQVMNRLNPAAAYPWM
jgi:imidazolonepropionase-like amidohydrolase